MTQQEALDFIFKIYKNHLDYLVDTLYKGRLYGEALKDFCTHYDEESIVNTMFKEMYNNTVELNEYILKYIIDNVNTVKITEALAEKRNKKIAEEIKRAKEELKILNEELKN